MLEVVHGDTIAKEVEQGWTVSMIQKPKQSILPY